MSASLLAQFFNRTLPLTRQAALARFSGRRVAFVFAGVSWILQIDEAGQWGVPDHEGMMPADLTLQIEGSDFVWIVQGVDALSRRAQIAGDAGLLEAVGQALKEIDASLLFSSNALTGFPLAQALLEENLMATLKTISLAARAAGDRALSYIRDERAWLVSKAEAEGREAQLLSLLDRVARLNARLNEHLKVSPNYA